jgi:hypothetical protein
MRIQLWTLRDVSASLTGVLQHFVFKHSLCLRTRILNVFSSARVCIYRKDLTFCKTCRLLVNMKKTGKSHRL